MEHPNKDTLNAYAERLLDAGEMTAVIRHLDDCKECFARVRSRYSATDAAVFAAEEIPFHLDYDEHLQPYVDDQANAVVRELVESHTQDCGECSFQLRELREFSESLRLHELEMSKAASGTFLDSMFEAWRTLAYSRTLRLVIPLVLVFIAFAAVLLFVRSRQPGDVAVNTVPGVPNPTVSNNTSVAVPEVEVANVQPPVPVSNSVPPVIDQISPPPSDANKPNVEPGIVRSDVQKAISTGRLALPAFLATFRTAGVRGDNEGLAAKISPDRESVRSTTPSFNWKGSSGEEYVVTIFDENDDPIEKSPPTKANTWKPQTNLARGKNYAWEVRTVGMNNAVPARSGRFRVIDQASLADINSISKASPLQRGIVLAEKGVLTEAATEFRRAIKTNENPTLARRFLLQVSF